MTGKIRWGVLSTARIGVAKVIPAMQRGELCDVVAIASRTEAKAQAAARSLGIPHAFGSYEALLASPDIDAIYNPLPNDGHVPWSIRALEAGKHVLCEKPIALSAAEGRTLADAAARFPRLKLMEAFMYRLHPQWRTTKQLVDSGRIGSLKTIQTFFSFYNDDPANIRHDPAMGGGALMDIGCYAISLSRWLFGREPERVQAHVAIDPRYGVDRTASSVLDFGSGTASFTCSMTVAPLQVVQVVGDAGRIELSEVPFNAPADRPCVVRLQVGDGPVERLEQPCVISIRFRATSSLAPFSTTCRCRPRSRTRSATWTRSRPCWRRGVRAAGSCRTGPDPPRQLPGATGMQAAAVALG